VNLIMQKSVLDECQRTAELHNDVFLGLTGDALDCIALAIMHSCNSIMS